MSNLFDSPIKEREVKNGIIAYQYRNGTINIEGEKYVCYSMTGAIKAWRKKNNIKK